MYLISPATQPVTLVIKDEPSLPVETSSGGGQEEKPTGSPPSLEYTLKEEKPQGSSGGTMYQSGCAALVFATLACIF